MITLFETTTPEKLPLYVLKSSTMLIAPKPESVGDDIIVFPVTCVPGAPNRTMAPSVDPETCITGIKADPG